MKKLFILVAAIVTLSATASAQDYSFLAKLDNETTLNGLSRYLQTSYEQDNYLQQIFEMSSAKYARAAKNGEISDEAARKVLAFNLSNTKYVLNAEQYQKYLKVLNVTALNSQNVNLLVASK